MPPDGKIPNQIDQILIERQRHASVLEVRSFRAVDCDMDHSLVVANFRERIAMNNQGSHIFHTERLNLKRLNEIQGKEKYYVEVSSRFSTLED
jgi:hypothetical protein